MLNKILIIFVAVSIILPEGNSQMFRSGFDKVPVNSGFRMEGYWVWCGSMIKVGETYHLFAARWPKTGPFPEGYRHNSEIVRATSDSPIGPFKFEEVVIGERDSSFWDSNMAHNPTIQKIGNEFVLFYIGSDFTTINPETGNLLRRVGYASSESITGPWKRCDIPVINSESNNPALLVERTKVKLMYRDASLKIYIAESENYRGPYKIMNENVWPEGRLEDFFLFRSAGMYHMVCEDNKGVVSGHERWGVHLFSENGIDNWKKYDPVVVYNHEIIFSNGTVLNCTRRERPQFLITSNKITHLITGVYDGKDSWSQPVELKKNVRID